MTVMARSSISSSMPVFSASKDRSWVNGGRALLDLRPVAFERLLDGQMARKADVESVSALKTSPWPPADHSRAQAHPVVCLVRGHQGDILPDAWLRTTTSGSVSPSP
jgi:hypothetical protein